MKIKNELLKGMARLVAIWTASCIVMFVGKIVFYSVYSDLAGEDSGFFRNIAGVLSHGFRMDSTVAAYISVIPALLISFSLLVKMNVTGWISRFYFILVSILLSAIFTVDSALYGYWGFKLDATPIFYFTTSPASAMASMTWIQIAGGFVTWILGSVAIWFIYRAVDRVFPMPEPSIKGRGRFYPLFMLIFSSLLIIPLRGGLTVSTTNLSSAYYSKNTFLNHCAVNPAFSLLYSLTHQADFRSEFRFMEPEKASSMMLGMIDLNDKTISDSTLVLSPDRPDIYIIILESFSSHLFPSLGGEPVALKLDSIARENILFTEFYANGFRTDRGIPAILSGFPAQPTTSVMKFVEKAAKLPSLAGALKKAGYEAEYYYGGDANFTNMQAYLVNSGFSTVMSDKDFSLSEKMSKWGAHDDIMLSKVKENIKKNAVGDVPRLRVIQTSSSHEPFDVPYANPAFSSDPRLNAFAFTDSCVADFIDNLKTMPKWDKTLVVLVPDHYGVYPEQLDSLPLRHKIPLILAGGALGGKKCRIPTVGSQVDIAASLLSLLGMDHSEFKFSNNIFSDGSPHYAFLAGRNEIGMIDQKNCVSYNIENNRTVINEGSESRLLLEKLKSYIQTLYNTLADL